MAVADGRYEPHGGNDTLFFGELRYPIAEGGHTPVERELADRRERIGMEHANVTHDLVEVVPPVGDALRSGACDRGAAQEDEREGGTTDGRHT
ncbi:MAG TPA: hypothetical protein VFV19_16620 [Candidatus Polarisedimenticolaceae bacterium]|nr:hypothetical protein [Candidatus Polarisedimenticolaceae bacterium]